MNGVAGDADRLQHRDVGIVEHRRRRRERTAVEHARRAASGRRQGRLHVVGGERLHDRGVVGAADGEVAGLTSGRNGERRSTCTSVSSSPHE